MNKFSRASFLLVMLLSVFKTVATELPIKIDPHQWALVVESTLKSVNENSQQAFTSAQRNLLTQIQPFIQNEQYTQAKELIDAFTEPKNGMVWRLYAQVLFSLDDLNAAQRAFLKAKELLPDDTIILQNLATLYLLQGDVAKAQRYIAQCIQRGLENAQIYAQLGYVNLTTALPMSAIAPYQKALMYEPDNQQWYRGLLFAYIKSNSFDEARYLVERMLQDHPEDAGLWLQRAQLLLDTNRQQQALASLEAAYLLGENSQDITIRLARLHITNGSLARALTIIEGNLESLLASNNDDQARYFEQIYSVGQMLVTMQSWTDVKKLTDILNQTALSSEQNSKVLLLESKVYIARKNYIAAIKTLEKTIEISPDNADAIIELANLSASQGNTNRAQLLYQRASAFEQYALTASLGLAQISINKRDYKTALELLRKIYTDNPSRSDLLKNITTLENIVN